MTFSDTVPMFEEPRADPAPPAEPTEERPAISATEQRFASCRWHKPAEGQQPSHCTHREVLPMAGVHGFNPESWCPDCGLFKLRRVPRKTLR
jgi:hypothetical protein